MLFAQQGLGDRDHAFVGTLRQQRIEVSQSANRIFLAPHQLDQNLTRLVTIAAQLQERRQSVLGFMSGGDRRELPLILDRAFDVRTLLAQLRQLLQQVRITRVLAEQAL